MTDPAKPLKMTEEEYLALERDSDVRHEFVDGVLYAMSGAKRKHNRIILNIARALSDAADARNCEVYTESVQLHFPSHYYYPDLIVTCEELDPQNPYLVRSPCFLVEVWSPSTGIRDINEKLPAYTTHLPSLEQILYVSSDERRAQLYTRTPEGWLFKVLEGDDALEVKCLGATLTLEQVYQRVNLAE